MAQLIDMLAYGTQMIADVFFLLRRVIRTHVSCVSRERYLGVDDHPAVVGIGDDHIRLHP